MPTTKAIRSFLIIPFLLLAGCQEQPKPIAYQLVCKADPDSVIAEIAKIEAALSVNIFEEYVECLKANPAPSASYIFEADVLETKEGVIGETYQHCNLEGSFVKESNEWPMTVSWQYLNFEAKGAFEATGADGATIISKVDRRTLTLDRYSEAQKMSCKLNDIFDDRAI